jgi:hypothetical protein
MATQCSEHLNITNIRCHLDEDIFLINEKEEGKKGRKAAQRPWACRLVS